MGMPQSGIRVAPNELSLTISNLTINTEYRVSVVGITSAGEGVPANETGRTDEDGMLKKSSL